MKMTGENGVIAQFLLDCRVKNRSKHTLELYERGLRFLVTLLEALCNVDELEQVTTQHLRQCVQHLHTAPSPASGKVLALYSVREYVLVWKAFFNWCYQEELIEKNPVTRLKLPKLEKRIKPTLTSDEVQVMLDSCDLKTSLGFRDYIILMLLVDTGLRLAEIANLSINDVHQGYVKVFGKGRREREVGLHPEVYKLIWKYVQKHRHAADTSETALFLSRWGEPLHEKGVYKLVKRIQERCGFEDKEITPHVFRHTFSKQFMKRGGDILSLSRELGHSDIQVTRLYLQDFSSEDARKDHDKRSMMNDIKITKRKKERRERNE